MLKFGSGENGELTFLDILAIASFLVGMQNLDLNLAQEDLDAQTKELDKSLREVVDDIHKHLKEQDEKIDTIMEILYDKNQEVSRRD